MWHHSPKTTHPPIVALWPVFAQLPCANTLYWHAKWQFSRFLELSLHIQKMNYLYSLVIDNIGRLRSSFVVVEQIWLYTKYNQPMDSSNNFNLRQVKVPTNSSPIFKSGYRWGVMGVPTGWLLPPRHRSAIHGKGQCQKTRQSIKRISTRRESMKTVGPNSWFKRSRSRQSVQTVSPVHLTPEQSFNLRPLAMNLHDIGLLSTRKLLGIKIVDKVIKIGINSNLVD